MGSRPQCSIPSCSKARKVLGYQRNKEASKALEVETVTKKLVSSSRKGFWKGLLQVPGSIHLLAFPTHPYFCQDKDKYLCLTVAT